MDKGHGNDMGWVRWGERCQETEIGEEKGKSGRRATCVGKMDIAGTVWIAELAGEWVRKVRISAEV